MHRQTRATSNSAKVKDTVAKRDCTNGPATCILCGAPGGPHCHVVRRSQGGRGVEENIVTLCDKCHYAFDEGLFMDRLRRWDLTAGRTSVLISSTTSKDFTLTGARRR